MRKNANNAYLRKSMFLLRLNWGMSVCGLAKISLDFVVLTLLFFCLFVCWFVVLKGHKNKKHILFPSFSNIMEAIYWLDICNYCISYEYLRLNDIFSQKKMFRDLIIKKKTAYSGQLAIADRNQSSRECPL